MSLSVIPLTILGQITGVSGSGETALYQVSFKSIDGTPLYGVTAVWTDEQAEIEALAAQKPYGVWINPIDGTFTVKFVGYTYVGSADLTDSDVLTGITPIEFTSAEVSDRLLPEVTAEDNGKILQVVDGNWQAAESTNTLEISATSFPNMLAAFGAKLTAISGANAGESIDLGENSSQALKNELVQFAKTATLGTKVKMIARLLGDNTNFIITSEISTVLTDDNSSPFRSCTFRVSIRTMFTGLEGIIIVGANKSGVLTSFLYVSQITSP